MADEKKEQDELHVAISFLKDDELIASTINDLIQDRLNTFIYSKRQEELVGFDGEEKFNEVFNKRARLVVILYRQNWGQTRWTRIEMNAIKNRAFDNGYDFAIFVPLDKSDLPIWVPKTTIWHDFDRWGAKGLASVIEAKLSATGIEIKKTESAIEYAARMKRKADLAKEIETYLDTSEAYKDANHEFGQLVEKVRGQNQQLGELGLSKGLTEQSGREITIKVREYSLTFYWRLAYSNSLRDSLLIIRITKRTREWFENPIETVKSLDYTYHLNELKRKGWKLKGKGEFHDTDDLVEKWIKELVVLLK